MTDHYEKSSVPGEHFPMEELRNSTYESMRKAVEERMRKDPMPTDQEILIGSYLEDLEPSVRDAILVLNKKGYRTQSSGFGGSGRYELQQMDGPFEIDKETEKKLKAMGVNIRRNEEYQLTYIEFEPSVANLEVIKKKWDEVAELLPGLGKPNLVPGGPWLSERWLNDKKIQKLCLKRRLALGAYNNIEEKSAIEKQLAEL